MMHLSEWNRSGYEKEWPLGWGKPSGLSKPDGLRGRFGCGVKTWRTPSFQIKIRPKEKGRRSMKLQWPCLSPRCLSALFRFTV